MIWLVVFLEHDWMIFPEIQGISSSQWTNSYFSGVLKPPTSKHGELPEIHHLWMIFPARKLYFMGFPSHVWHRKLLPQCLTGWNPGWWRSFQQWRSLLLFDCKGFNSIQQFISTKQIQSEYRREKRASVEFPKHIFSPDMCGVFLWTACSMAISGTDWLEVPTIFFRPMWGNIPKKYGPKYGTNVPPF